MFLLDTKSWNCQRQQPPTLFYPKQNRVKVEDSVNSIGCRIAFPFALAKGNAILHPMLFTLSSHRNSTRRPIIFPVEPLTRSPSLPVLVSPPLIPSSDVVSGISRNKRRVKSKIPRVSPRLGQASNELTDSRVSRFSAEWIRACLLRLADRNAVMEAAEYRNDIVEIVTLDAIASFRGPSKREIKFLFKYQVIRRRFKWFSRETNDSSIAIFELRKALLHWLWCYFRVRSMNYSSHKL